MRPRLVVALLLAPVLAHAEGGAATPAVGKIVGTVRVARPPGKLPIQKIAKDSSVCGTEATSEAAMVGADGALANAVISVGGLKPTGAPGPTPGAVVDQVGCRYTPHVQAVTVGTALTLMNNDAVLHNVHGVTGDQSKSMSVFNLAMPFKGGKIPTVLKRPGIIKLRCDAGHTWMSAYVHVFDHPHFAVSDGKGRFTIENVPPGRHTVEFWHEPLDGKGSPTLVRMAVEVIAGKTSAADATLVL